MNTDDKFLSLYKITLSLVINQQKTINIPNADIVSIVMINNYDTMTYPIIRIRLYSDISIIQSLAENSDNTYIRGNFDGCVYKMNDENKAPIMIKPIKNIVLNSKIYIENKNIASSTMDQYVNGAKKNKSLNENIKVPITLYCYDETLIHNMNQVTQSVYKNMSINSIIEDIFVRGEINNYQIDPITNQTKYDQLLIPNLSIAQSLSYFDVMCGLYSKGAQLFGDIDKLYLCNLDVNGNKPLPIYVDDSKTNTDMSGMRNIQNDYYMTTMAGNVSINTITDINRVTNTNVIKSINLNNLDTASVELDVLYAGSDIKKISTPNILHKTKSPYLPSTNAARINEQMTMVDISGVGFDVGKMKVNSRYNLVFNSPIRGAKMNTLYRATYTCHSFTNMDCNLFIAQTTMNLCNN